MSCGWVQEDAPDASGFRIKRCVTSGTAEQKRRRVVSDQRQSKPPPLLFGRQGAPQAPQAQPQPQQQLPPTAAPSPSFSSGVAVNAPPPPTAQPWGSGMPYAGGSGGGGGWPAGGGGGADYLPTGAAPPHAAAGPAGGPGYPAGLAGGQMLPPAAGGAQPWGGAMPQQPPASSPAWGGGGATGPPPAPQQQVFHPVDVAPVGAPAAPRRPWEAAPPAPPPSAAATAAPQQGRPPQEVTVSSVPRPPQQKVGQPSAPAPAENRPRPFVPRQVQQEAVAAAAAVVERSPQGGDGEGIFSEGEEEEDEEDDEDAVPQVVPRQALTQEAPCFIDDLKAQFPDLREAEYVTAACDFDTEMDGYESPGSALASEGTPVPPQPPQAAPQPPPPDAPREPSGGGVGSAERSRRPVPFVPSASRSTSRSPQTDPPQRLSPPQQSSSSKKPVPFVPRKAPQAPQGVPPPALPAGVEGGSGVPGNNLSPAAVPPAPAVGGVGAGGVPAKRRMPVPFVNPSEASPVVSPPMAPQPRVLLAPQQPGVQQQQGMPPPVLQASPPQAPPAPPQAGAEYNPLHDFPPSVRQAFAARGITSMYDWQKTVLGLPKVRDGGNLVFSLPTSGGKSLVAELLLLRTVAARRSGILVMPFVALVDEKVAALEPFTKALGFEITASAGNNSQIPLQGNRFISICTIEKANALLNTMANEGRSQEIGCLVVDELHMVGEDGRGPVLEMLLTKVMHTIPRCQIVGMSATLPNLGELAKWLRAELFLSDFRPVVLECFMLSDTQDQTQVLSSQGTVVRSLPKQQNDDRSVAYIVNEVVPDGCCLVFCTTKRNCQNVAGMLSTLLSEEARAHNSTLRERLLLDMKGVAGGTLDAEFEKYIRAGIAYHHAGLLGEERLLIEEAYKKKVLCVICCTSTLAAGVNLPARRVVIRHPYTGRAFLTKSRYLQMCGRAGRAGLDATGQSYLIAQKKDIGRARGLMAQDIEPLSSKLLPPEAIERVILDAIATQTVVSAAGLKAYAEAMLFPQQDNVVNLEKYYETFDTKLKDLIASRIVMCEEEEGGPEGGRLSCSSFGASAFKSGFTLREASLLKRELLDMQNNGIILGHDLHMLYYLTPIKDIETWRVNWYSLSHILANTSKIKRQIADMIGISESFVILKQNDDRRNNPECNNEYKCRRFWCALILSDLLAEMPIADVAKRYSSERGDIQKLQFNAALFCSMMVGFTESMGWTSLQVTIQSYVKRLGCGVKADCAHLTEIRGVQAGRARCMWNAGFKTLQSIANTDVDNLYERVRQAGSRAGRENPAAKFFSRGVAQQVVSAAKALLAEKVEEKRRELSLLVESKL